MGKEAYEQAIEGLKKLLRYNLNIIKCANLVDLQN